ncbi:MAG TPA: carboxypeptidase regulatory-like domain-containing protein [Planctomycetota bacterium]|nr:carboxypeptidase regulatory-like domain-containing protein [Planctomycetota bacterium]
MGLLVGFAFWLGSAGRTEPEDGRAKISANDLTPAASASLPPEADSPAPQPLTQAAESALAQAASQGIAREARKPAALSTFRGRVVDHLGVPLADATVIYWPNAATSESYGLADSMWSDRAAIEALPRTLTSRDGRFELQGRHISGPDPTGMFVDPMLVVVEGAHAIRSHRCQGFSGGDYDTRDIVLEPGGWVSGRVVDRARRPVAGATIMLSKLRGRSLEGIVGEDASFEVLTGVFASTRSGEDGAFESGELWDGTVQVGVQAEGFLDRWLDDLTAITAGQASDLGDIAMDAGAGLTGIVRDESGGPLADARVLVAASNDPAARLGRGEPDPVVRWMYASRDEQGVRTDDQGRFSIDTLRPINYSLLVEAAGFEPVRMDDLLPGRSVVAVTLGQPATLHLRVVDAATGEPVAGAQAEGLRSSSKSKSSWLQAIPLPTEPGAAPGEVVVSRLGLARTQVTVAAPGYASQIFDLDGATPPEDVSRQVSLIRGAVLQGRVLGSDGAVVPGAEVVLQPQDSWRAKQRVVQPDKTGHYELPDLGPGEWTLVGDGPDRAPVAQTVFVVEGESPSEVDLVLPFAASVFGTCFGVDGKPERGVEKEFHRREKDGVPAKVFSARSDSAGHYELSDMPLGRWLVEDNPTIEFDLHAGERVQLDLRKQPDASVSGRVLHSDGTPAAGAWVFVSRVRASGRTLHAVRGDSHGEWEWKPALIGQLEFVGMVTGGGGSSSVGSLELQKSEQRTIDVVLGDGRVTGLVVEDGAVVVNDCETVCMEVH